MGKNSLLYNLIIYININKRQVKYKHDINAKISIGKYVYKRTIVILVNINKITICEVIVYVSIKKICVKMLLESAEVAYCL